jgi:ankyrin repeat protein
MALFDKFKKLNIAHRKIDEALYSAVAQEMEDGVRHNGLWLKALEQAEGNKEKQVAEYIKLRVQSLQDDINIHSNSVDPNNNISHGRDIESLVTMLNSNISVAIIGDYFSGMPSQDIKDFINLHDACEDCPIHVSVKIGRIDLTQWLLDAGANPLAMNYWGSTALDIAERNDDKDALSLLQGYLL